MKDSAKNSIDKKSSDENSYQLEKEQSGNKKDGLIEINGTIEHVIFRNEANGYAVCDLAVSDTELITIVGVLPFISEGEQITAMGSWEMHSSFGRQFKVQYYEKKLPSDEAAILKYLSARTVKGIGPITAQKIVEKFGGDTFDVLENHPEFLAGIPGISLKKAEEMSESFRQQFGIRSVMMFCRDFFGPATAVRIYKRWGVSAVDIIKDNPYILCDEIYGIGFERADRIAQTLGIELNSTKRIEAGMKYLIAVNGQTNGHVCVPEDKLLAASSSMLKADIEDVIPVYKSLVNDGDLVAVKIYGKKCVYLKSYYNYEKYTAAKLELLENSCVTINDENIEIFIDQIERDEGIQYASMQRKAIKSAINSGVMVLTGGPGTGKTTVIKAVIRVFELLGYDFVLAAPTGRAAKRMSEATQHEAKTIHRLLEMEYSEGELPKFKRDENNLIEEKVIIVDEASMVDISIMAALLKAIKPGARLILIGDIDQLPSVGAGNVLHDIIESERFNTVNLKEIFRQAKESLIVTNAHAINSGEYPELSAKSSDFFFISRDSDDSIAKTVADLYMNRLPKTYGEKIRENIQIITPSHKGSAGTAMLNILLQKVLNPPSPRKKEKKKNEIIFREGDKVMQIRNNYDIEWEKNGKEGTGIFNGDIGIITNISIEDETLVIDFDERVAIYDFSMLDEIEHAYAITIHKSQGSEYPVVIIPLYSCAPRLLTRNLLYTAVTRAQSMVVLVGKREIVGQMVENNFQFERYTGLKYLLSCYR